LDKENSRRNINKKPRQVNEKGSSKIGLIIIFIILISLAIAFFVATRGREIDMTESNVLFTRDYELSTKSDFYTYGDNIFHTTKDSLVLLDENGNEVWKDSFTMLYPVMRGDKNAVALAEKNGTKLRVYNENGLLYKMEFEQSLITFTVNGMGYIGAVNKKDSDYELLVCNQQGEEIHKSVFVADEGIPTAVDISEDGSVLAVSFMNINNIKLTSNVTFYYIDGNKTESTESGDGMFASELFEDSMPVALRFLADNNCVAVMDNKLAFIDCDESEGVQKVEVPIGNSISYACVNGDGTTAVAFGEPLLNAAERLEKNTVIWYDSKGNKINEYKSRRDITGLYPGEDITVIAMNREFEAYGTGGGYIWSYTAVQDTSKVLPYNGKDKMLAVTPVKATLTRVGKGNRLKEIAPEDNATTPSALEEATGAEATEAVTSVEETTLQEGTTEPSETNTVQAETQKQEEVTQ